MPVQHPITAALAGLAMLDFPAMHFDGTIKLVQSEMPIQSSQKVHRE